MVVDGVDTTKSLECSTPVGIGESVTPQCLRGETTRRFSLLNSLLPRFNRNRPLGIDLAVQFQRVVMHVNRERLAPAGQLDVL